jgi:propionyl-CoA carboxylase alpha chain
MENILKAEQDCVIGSLMAKPGESLSVDQVIIEFAAG